MLGSEEPPKAPVRALPTTCPTADPTATPAAVLAICAISPGCAGCAAGTGAAGAGLRERSGSGRAVGGSGAPPGPPGPPPPLPGRCRCRRGPRRAPPAARHRLTTPRARPARRFKRRPRRHVTPRACALAAPEAAPALALLRAGGAALPHGGGGPVPARARGRQGARGAAPQLRARRAQGEQPPVTLGVCLSPLTNRRYILPDWQNARDERRGGSSRPCAPLRAPVPGGRAFTAPAASPPLQGTPAPAEGDRS